MQVRIQVVPSKTDTVNVLLDLLKVGNIILICIPYSYTGPCHSFIFLPKNRLFYVVNVFH